MCVVACLYVLGVSIPKDLEYGGSEVSITRLMSWDERLHQSKRFRPMPLLLNCYHMLFLFFLLRLLLRRRCLRLLLVLPLVFV